MLKSHVGVSRVVCLALVLLSVFLLGRSASAKSFWVTGYVPSWEERAGYTPDKIDFSAMDTVIHFVLLPAADGTIDVKSNLCPTPEESQSLIAAAHAAKVKVLISVGGAGSGDVLKTLITDAKRPTFVAMLLGFVHDRGYDGLDIDMEPIDDADVGNYAKFIGDLRAGLDKMGRGHLLTAAVGGETDATCGAMFQQIQDKFDQINIMAYDMAGPWPGWKVWYNASLFDDGPAVRLDDGAHLPTAKSCINSYTACGVKPSKLGLGIPFSGYVWKGVSQPLQPIDGASADEVGYNEIMDKYYQPDRYHRDTVSHASYMSIDAPAAADRMFISYDDPALIADKVAYCKQQKLGGVMMWDISYSYRPNQPVGQQDVLVQAVKTAVHSR